jgi:hypothetical protein
LDDAIFDDAPEFAPKEQYGNKRQEARQRMKSKFDVAGPE